jgi:hypothetical protein
MSAIAPDRADLQIAQHVHDLAASIPGHEALSNEFYTRWIDGPLTYAEVRVFAEQYLARTVNTAVMVALSVLHTADLRARVECVKNLYSEYGNGDPNKAHLVLLETFLSDFLTRLVRPTRNTRSRRSNRPSLCATTRPTCRSPATASPASWA